MQANCIQLAWLSSRTESSIVSRRSNKSTRGMWQISPELKGRWGSRPTDYCQLCVLPIEGINDDREGHRLFCQGKGSTHWNATENESVLVSISKTWLACCHRVMLTSFMHTEENFNAWSNLLLKFREIKDLGLYRWWQPWHNVWHLALTTQVAILKFF